ncbi:hypothetical protein H0H92_003927, partial [Tricholoma furcatifolium]
MNRGLEREELRDATKKSQTLPFFSSRNVLDLDEDSDNETEPEIEEEVEPHAQTRPTSTTGAWFKKPKRMPDWLYQYFGRTIAPLIFTKEGRELAKPPPMSESYARTYSPASFWVTQPEPAILLARHCYNPSVLYQPRIFLWLPHFYVQKLYCPRCSTGILEKNGALAPRRITDTNDSFYIISWAYYCRKQCKAYFSGWSNELMASLPAYLQHSFPATLSHKGGLSNNVVMQLRVANQHKMGPSGVRSLLFELHTHRFSVLQAQYLESIFELVRGRQDVMEQQLTLHEFISEKFPSFGDFADPQGYAGFVPSETYLANMLNRAIERDEIDANQHTACLAPDQLAIDDSHKINKHIAKVDGVAVFGALWTCMTSCYIRAQALTLTKSHEERAGPLLGIANSVKRYGFSDPPVVFSDDPVKDKQMIYTAFPSLTKKLTPVAATHGLTPIEIPHGIVPLVLDSMELIEGTFAAYMAPLDLDPAGHLCASVDAEWNISRQLHRFSRLPTSLLRFILSAQVFKIGSNIKGDFTRLKKQFTELAEQKSFNVIELKDYCIQRGIIKRGASGSLDTLVEKALHMYLPKDAALRKSEDWESRDLSYDLQNYAALDVYASRMVFEKVTEVTPLKMVSYDTPSGTSVALTMQEGGDAIAYGTIAAVQPGSLGGVRVKTPSKNRLVVDVNTLLNPSAAAILHHMPRLTQSSTKSGCLTLGQLCAASPSTPQFQVVAPVSLLVFDPRDRNTMAPTPSQKSSAPSSDSGANLNDTDPVLLGNQTTQADECDNDDPNSNCALDRDTPAADDMEIDMLEAFSCTFSTASVEDHNSSSSPAPSADPIAILEKLVNSPSTSSEEFQGLKKDIFHAFHSINTPLNHGARPLFLRALRDHMLRWDPNMRAVVDRTCRQHFNLTFDQMLERNPRWIAERTPRHVPRPSILVPALDFVFKCFGNVLDAKTQQPLFNKLAWKKAEAILELARLGYLSDPEGVSMFKKSTIDKYGLQKYICIRGTNNVEGGPHGDIYRKFGALHGPRLTALAKHLHGVDWDYHHCLSLINRSAFLLNYLSDVIDGAGAYTHWINGDLYERTTEQFGICHVPVGLRMRLGMEPYSKEAASKFNKLNANDDWLRRRQGLALPALPPTTLEARKYFFSKIAEFAARASADGKTRIDWVAFAVEWNHSADGVTRFYITAEVLAAYAKTWEKANNIRATQELISDQLDDLSKTRSIFAAPHIPMPSFLTSSPVSVQPSQGVIDIIPDDHAAIPASLTIQLPLSHPSVLNEPPVIPPSLARLDPGVPQKSQKRTTRNLD